MELSWAEFPDLTLLIRRFQSGDREAERQFFHIGYRYLEKLAAIQLTRESFQTDTSPQELLHDLYVNRIRTWDRKVNDRGHFAALISMALKDELRDRARRRKAQKRTAPATSQTAGSSAAAHLATEEILAIERELDRLAQVDERAAHVVRLRYYGGCSWDETASATGAPVKAVRNDWEFAANWLAKRLGHKYF
jgi:RNA polymerase sigma factor (TIGR02999 family)